MNKVDMIPRSIQDLVLGCVISLIAFWLTLVVLATS